MPELYFTRNTSLSGPRLVKSLSGDRAAGLCLPAAGVSQPLTAAAVHVGTVPLDEVDSAPRRDGLGEPGLPVLPYLPNN